MTSRYARLLALVTLVMLMASGPAFAQTDYDTDNDNLIDITSLAQLNAIRWDLNGDGVVSSTDSTNYFTAFSNPASGMGCPATCTGYELLNNLDFDENNDDDITSADATYWNNGDGWQPIGGTYTGNFKGNGYTIDNLFIDRSSTDNIGLFSQFGSGSRVETLGLTNANVTLSEKGGILVYSNSGTIVACYTTGTITGVNRISGLVGMFPTGSISTSYSHASVTSSTNSSQVGGLAGYIWGDATITNSYFAGSLTGANPGGLVGDEDGGSASDSYWDSSKATGSVPKGSGQSTSNLQTPTGYTGIYANWNLNLDGNTNTGDNQGNDDPWDFGTSNEYPVLQYDGHSPFAQGRGTDYDTDNDRLIDITSLAQLNAIRWDLNGDGAIDASASTSDTTAYNAAFPAPLSGMGCPSTGCNGYELLNNLDFDTDGSGSVDSNDDYPNWRGIGVAASGTATAFSAIFDGNDNTISNLLINSNTSTPTGGGYVGLFGDVSGTIRDVGLLDVNVTNTRTTTGVNVGRTGALAGLLNAGGTVHGSYVAGGSVTHTTSSTGLGYIGCLLGYSNGTVRDSYATCNVTGTNNFLLALGGLIGEAGSLGTVDTTYATGTVTFTGSGLVAGGLIGRAECRVSVSYATGNVSGSSTGRVGGLIGRMEGPSFASYATGNVSGNGTGTGATDALSLKIGGLIGQIDLGASEYLRASYATGNVSGSGTGVKAGGLIGRVTVNTANSISAVYAIGAVSNASTGTTATGGLAAEQGSSTTPMINSYWDTLTTGQTTTAGTSSNTTGAQTTSALQSPTGYTGSIYANWNQNLDGQPGNDDPWTFGATNQYPVLKYAGLDTTAQFTLQPPGRPVVAVTSNADTLYVGWRAASRATGYTVQWKSGMQSYDASRQATTTATLYKIPDLTTGTTYTVRVIATKTGARDGSSVEVMRAPGLTNYDTDGDGLIAITTLAQLNAIRHDLNGNGDATHADYDSAFPGRDTSSSTRMGCLSGCTGYELLNDLDFDENTDGAITSADATYWNSGNGWQPIGTQSSAYATTFKGNGHIINNLFISRGSISYVGLFGNNGTGGRIETLGVTNAEVTGSHGSGILAGGNEGGTVVACFSTGSVSGDQYTGGLVGYVTSGTISTSYSTASVSGSSSVGGLVGYHAGSVTDTYSIGRVSGSGANVSGLVGSKLNSASTSRSFWDTQTSNRATSNGGGTGKTTSELQSATTYGATSSDLYFNWNVNLDGQAGNDDPWTFGATNQYPVLKYAGMDTTAQFKLQPAVVTLALTPSSISENGGMSTVTATLAHPLSAATTITVRPVAGAYTVAADSTITIAAGSTANASDTVVITAVDNTQDAPNRGVDMSVVAGNAQGAGRVTTTLTLTLEDDDPAPIATLAANPLSILENGAVSTITASLSRPSSAATTITVRPLAGAYEVSATDSTITIAAGDTTNASDTVVITAVDNSQDAPARDVTVSGVMSNAQGAGSVTGASLTLTDDDAAPTVTMVVSPSSISEAVEVSTVTATLSHTSSAATTITVSVPTSSDYTLSTPNTLTVAAGESTSTGTVTITTVNNNIASGNKTVTVTGTPTNSVGVMSSVTAATLTITDDDVAQVTLVLTPASITENAEVSTITATLDRTATAATTVTVSAMAVSPAVAGDFTLSTTTTLTFAANVTTSTGSVTITSVNDTTDAPDKEVTVSATVTGGNMASAPADVTLTITDDEDAPTVALTLSPASIAETGDVSTITATLSHSSSAITTITVRPVAGAYTVGSDSTIIIAAGSTANATDTVEITAVDNATDAPNNSLTVSIAVSNDQGAGSVTGTALTITDDDAAPDVTLTLMPSSISENGGVSTVSATLTHPSSEATTITVRPVANAYTVGSDSTIIIAAGSTANATDTVALTAVDNDIDASDNAVMVQTAAVENDHGAGNVQAASLTITDDDEAAIDVSPMTSTTVRLQTTESGRAETFTVTLASEPTGNVALSVVSSDTTEGTVSPSVLTFMPSNWNTAQTVTVTGQDDTPSAIDGNQNYTVTLSVNQTDTQDTNYDALTDISVYMVNRDNDFGLDISAVTGQATEAGASATFTVALLTQPSAAVTVSVTSQDPSEGRVEPAVLTFTTSGYNTAQTVTVTGQDDIIDDGDVTWTVRLDPSSGDTNYNALADDVQVTTTDNDEAPTVTLVLMPSSISENGGVSTVSATLSHPSSAITTITVSATPVSPATASDFTLSGADTLIIAATATTSTGTVTITAVNNMTDAPAKRVTVSGVANNDQGAGSVTDETLVLTDDDEAPTATLVLMPSSISENGGVSTITATLSHSSSAATTITVRPVADAYTVGSDSTITIAAGSTANATDTVEITAVDNTTDAANKNVTVTGVAGNAQGVSSVTGAALTLEDDDAAPDVTLMLSPASISEAGGVSTVTATLTHPSSAATTITVRPVANAYTVGSDSTITIAAGQMANASDTVALTAVDNDIDAADNAVTVQAAVENDHGEGNVQVASLTITDDDIAAIDVSAMTTTTVRLETTESGRTATFTVTLASEPTGNVALSVVSSNTDEGTVSPSVLTFSSTTWNTAQTVTVTGQDDTPSAIDGNQNYTVTLSVNQTDTQDTNYDALTDISVYMVNRDNDFGLDISALTGQATEAGASATFTVALLTQPTAAVTISVTSQDPSEGRVEPAMLTFTPTSYNTAQTVTVTGQDDTIDDGDIPWTVRLASSSGDTGYNTLADDVQMTTTDDEDAPTVTLVLMPSSISENAEVSTVSATLSHPSSAVTTITVSATPVSPATASDFTLSNADTLIIAATTTTSTDIVTITAVDNNDQADEKTVTVSATANNAQGITAPEPVTLTLTDDETPSANLDVDGDGRVRLFSDIILVIRYVLFFREEALLRGNVIEPTATRTTAQEIEPYLDTLVNQNILDVDGDGDVRLFSDIILIIRYVLFFRNEALVRGNVIEPTATRTTAQAIEPYIRSLYPDSHFQ